MPSDEYDGLLKAPLQRLARVRGLDDQGTVPMIRDRLRAWDAEQNPPAPEPPADPAPVDDDEDEDDSDAFLEDEEEEDEEEDDEEVDQDPVTQAVAMADPGSGPLRDNQFQFTVHAGNDLFFKVPSWHEANREMALLEAASAGYRHHPDMGQMEYVIDENTVHYRFPVEKAA